MVFPSTAIASLEGLQTQARTRFQGSAFQPTGENSTLGSVRKDLAIEDNFSGNAQIPLLKVLESGSVSQPVPLPKVAETGLAPNQVHQKPEVKQASLALNQKEALSTGTIFPPGKDVSSGLQKVGRLVHEDEALKIPILQRLSAPLARSQTVQPNQTAPATAIQVEGPAGFTEPGLTNQFSLKRIPGNSSVLHDLSDSVTVHRSSVPTDLLGESGLLSKGDRAQTIVETSVKNMGWIQAWGTRAGEWNESFSELSIGVSATISIPVARSGI